MEGLAAGFSENRWKAATFLRGAEVTSGAENSQDLGQSRLDLKKIGQGESKPMTPGFDQLYSGNRTTHKASAPRDPRLSLESWGCANDPWPQYFCKSISKMLVFPGLEWPDRSFWPDVRRHIRPKSSSLDRFFAPDCSYRHPVDLCNYNPGTATTRQLDI